MEAQRLKAIVDGIRTLEPWPPVAFKLMELSRREDVLPSELAAVVATDGALTARVLRLCNSAHYGFQREVTSLHEAGVRLGSRALVGLVLTTCVERSFTASPRRNDARGRRLWEHSLMGALAAGFLAATSGLVDRHEAYTGALLQDIGQLVILTACEDLEDEVRAQRQVGASRREAERAVYGLDHAQIGARLARRWQLPPSLVEVIEHHHEPEAATLEPRLVSICHLAEAVTRAVARGEGLGELAYELSGRALGLAGLSPTKLADLEDALLAQLGRARDLVRAA